MESRIDTGSENISTTSDTKNINDRLENSGKTAAGTGINEGKGQEKRSDLTIFEFPTLLIKNVYELLKLKRKVKYSEVSDNLGVSEATIKRAISWLKENGYINPEHSKVKGEWQLHHVNRTYFHTIVLRRLQYH